MASKTNVSVKCDAKSLYDPKLKAKLVDVMADSIASAIEGKSSGKLTTKGKDTEGFVLTASLASLAADDAAQPTQLDAKVTLSVLAVGTSAKAFNGSTSGSAKGFGARAGKAAEDLVADVVESFMPKVIRTILSL